MSIEKDREYFDKHIKDTHGHTVEWNNGLPVAGLDLMMWNIWQTSANRDGYKLAPVEPSEEMYLAGFEAKQSGLNTIEIYKAMIGACDDH